MSATGQALTLDTDARPRLAPFVRLRFDPVRGCHVLLSPEQVGVADAHAVEVLRRCDGVTPIGEIVEVLAQRFDADAAVILRDVVALLEPLAEARFLVPGGDGGVVSGPPDDVPLARPGPVGGADTPVPVGLLMELTHRCPLRCVYCSNPTNLDRRGSELSTETWQSVLRQAADLGVLQVHLSGGEPTLRHDLEALIATATDTGLYANLITAGIDLTRERLKAFQDAGLPHVQLSVQAADEAASEVISGYRNALDAKRRTADRVRELGMALTINAPVHRLNLDGLAGLIDFACDVDAQRIEIAHVQYYGWAARNRGHLLPTPGQVRESVRLVEAARRDLRGRLVVDFVAPDQHAKYPKPCMGGWGRNFINVTPAGVVLPCHAAQTIPGLVFENVRERRLDWIWRQAPSFNAFRGTGWMQMPCASCSRRTEDWGGCRCQALAVVGDAAATDPACHLSPHHARFRAGLAQGDANEAAAISYRGFSYTRER